MGKNVLVIKSNYTFKHKIVTLYKLSFSIVLLHMNWNKLAAIIVIVSGKKFMYREKERERVRGDEEEEIEKHFTLRVSYCVDLIVCYVCVNEWEKDLRQYSANRGA